MKSEQQSAENQSVSISALLELVLLNSKYNQMECSLGEKQIEGEQRERERVNDRYRRLQIGRSLVHVNAY